MNTKNKTPLEQWIEETKKKNLPLADLEKYVYSGITCPYGTVYSQLPGVNSRDKAEILFNKWKNEPKPIEKWSVESYVVAINDGHARGKPEDKYKIGFIDVITNKFSDETVRLEFSSNCCNKSDFEWFATKSEAEEFAKTLVEPVKHGNGILDATEVKQPLKQAVHCKTQEEWDFVTEKLGYKWSEYSKWSSYKNNTCINLNELGFGTAGVAYKGYQIATFQAWCQQCG